MTVLRCENAAERESWVNQIQSALRTANPVRSLWAADKSFSSSSSQLFALAPPTAGGHTLTAAGAATATATH